MQKAFSASQPPGGTEGTLVGYRRHIYIVSLFADALRRSSLSKLNVQVVFEDKIQVMLINCSLILLE